jgi:acetolactate synthase-1/2/3 large subunit
MRIAQRSRSRSFGAKTASPEKLVVAVIGEEAFCETALDIETSIRCNTPVLIIVANNRAFTDRDGGSSAKLANIRFGTTMEIGALATALGATAFKVNQPEQIAPALKNAISMVNAGTTAVVEIFTRRVKTSLYHLWETAPV